MMPRTLLYNAFVITLLTLPQATLASEYSTDVEEIGLITQEQPNTASEEMAAVSNVQLDLRRWTGEKKTPVTVTILDAHANQVMTTRTSHRIAYLTLPEGQYSVVIADDKGARLMTQALAVNTGPKIRQYSML